MAIVSITLFLHVLLKMFDFDIHTHTGLVHRLNCRRFLDPNILVPVFIFFLAAVWEPLDKCQQMHSLYLLPNIENLFLMFLWFSITLSTLKKSSQNWGCDALFLVHQIFLKIDLGCEHLSKSSFFVYCVFDPKPFPFHLRESAQN